MSYIYIKHWMVNFLQEFTCISCKFLQSSCGILQEIVEILYLNYVVYYSYI